MRSDGITTSSMAPASMGSMVDAMHMWSYNGAAVAYRILSQHRSAGFFSAAVFYYEKCEESN